jgi:uncharacterized integral membrane protein
LFLDGSPTSQPLVFAKIMFFADNPKSVIGVMMIIAYIFGQMIYCLNGAMKFRHSREALKQVTKRWLH